MANNLTAMNGQHAYGQAIEIGGKYPILFRRLLLDLSFIFSSGGLLLAATAGYASLCTAGTEPTTGVSGACIFGPCDAVASGFVGQPANSTAVDVAVPRDGYGVFDSSNVASSL